MQTRNKELKNRFMFRAAICGLAVISIGVFRPPKANGQSFRPLGASPDDQVLSVSPSGAFAVGMIGGAAGDAIQWTAADSLTLGSGQARDVAAGGSIIVGTTAENRPALWTGEGSLQILSDTVGTANAVSEDGTVVVGQSGTGATSGAFRWTAATGLVDIRWLSGGLVGGGIFTHASDVSGDGSVVVGAGRKALGTEAIRWTEDDRGVGLGDLPGGEFYSNAAAVSRDGNVIVGTSSSTLGSEAFRWTLADGLLPLGDLQGGDFFSEALDVSEDGSIVVGTATSGRGESEAFIWNANDGMQSLQDVLVSGFQLDLSDWELHSATAISADGKTIAGNGSGGAWIATIGQTKLGDFSGNGAINIVDVDMLSAAVASDRRQMKFDLNHDNQVNMADVSELLDIVGTLPGDADLDGTVTFADFLTISDNFGLSGATWSDGDFDSDASVGFSDFTILSAYFGQSGSMHVTSVPEPSAALQLTTFFAISLLAFRRYVA